MADSSTTRKTTPAGPPVYFKTEDLKAVLLQERRQESPDCAAAGRWSDLGRRDIAGEIRRIKKVMPGRRPDCGLGKPFGLI